MLTSLRRCTFDLDICFSHTLELLEQEISYYLDSFITVRSITGMDQNGPNYRNGLPEWTLVCAFEYDLCILLEQSGLGLP